MSFKCIKCNKTQPSGTKPFRDILEIQKVRYPRRYKNNDPMNEIIDEGGIGSEIVREGDLCSDCHSTLQVEVHSIINKVDNTLYETKSYRHKGYKRNRHE